MPLHNFMTDEDGAVTVDWVVMTAAVIGIGIAWTTSVGGAADEHTTRIGDTMSSIGIKTYGN